MRDRLVQAERVAAWREIARRLAHELKNPLFPLKITVENLQRAKQQAPELFDEVFEESTHTLTAELNNLTTIIGRFGDSSRHRRCQAMASPSRSGSGQRYTSVQPLAAAWSSLTTFLRAATTA